MKTFVCADTHFGHGNIMKFCPNTRQYRDADHMNAMLVQEWNGTVGVDDLTYILGDFAFLQASKASAIARMLNGRKILIQGNHDHKLLNDRTFRDCFEEVHMYHEINVDGTKVCMFHYRISEWNQCHRGSVHLFGHQHGSLSDTGNRSMDVGMDATGCVVLELQDAVLRMMKRDVIQPHHH